MIAEAVAFKAAAMQGRMDKLDEGASPASILAYGGTRPAAGVDPGVGALGSINLTKPSGTINSTTGVLSLTQAEDGLVLTTGEVTWCRVISGNGAFCFDIDAGEAGSGAEAIFADTQVYAGGALRLVSCALGS